MKRTFSFLLAFIIVAGMNLNSFAATALNNNENHPITTEEALSSSLSLGLEEESGISLGEVLAPNQTYRFPIMMDGAPIKAEQLENHRLRVETADGRNAVRSIKVVEDNGEYLLEVVTLSGYPHEVINYVGKLNLVKKVANKVEASMELTFSAGYASVAKESVESARKDGELYMDSSAPVITEGQFNFIDKELNGDKLNISADNWSYEVRISGQPSVNMVYNEKINLDIVRQFDEQNFAFLSFPAGPVFDFTGTLTIDVSDLGDNFGGNIYLYSYYNGRLNRIHAAYDEYEETLSFPTKYFGYFVITDKEIPNGTVVKGAGNSTVPSKPNSSKPNPETGAGF